MKEKEIEAYIGKWGFVTGHKMIDENVWLRSFPQNWFGKIIGYKKHKGFELRCYRKKRKNEPRHPHLYCEIKYFKPQP